ncbi:MAG TPA: hypothetical protein VF605_11830 [Allosphingosinicella sp.]|jgi:SOS-response transcriptional repressor LexA
MTPEQLRLLDFIREQIADNGLAPSYPEMERLLGRSRSSIHRLVTGLVHKGLLIRHRNQARGLTLPNEANIAGIPTDRLEAELRRRGRQPAWSREFLAGFARPELPLHRPEDSHG